MVTTEDQKYLIGSRAKQDACLESFHRRSAEKTFKLDGLPSDEAKRKEFSKAMQEYQNRLRDEGLFEPEGAGSWGNAWASAALLAGSLVFLALGGWWVAAGSLLLALHYCQAAYLSHDAAHGQITRNKTTLSWIFAALTFSHGMSLTWWRRKHSVHHANPNAIKSGPGGVRAIDDDIDTLPLICWDPRLMGQRHSPALRAWLSIQHVAGWLVFAILRLIWIAWGLHKGTPIERGLIAAHHGAIIAFPMLAMDVSWPVALAWLLGANLISGFGLACFFLFGHTGMEIYDQAERGDHWRAQMRSTRNFSPGRTATWLSGGLNYQIEHHLFPLLPRRHLPMVAKHVRKIAAIHGVRYEEIGMCQGLRKIGSALSTARPRRELP